MTVQTTSDRVQHIPPRRLWFGATGGAIAWALQGFVCFLITTQACADGSADWGPMSGMGVRVLLGCITLGFLLVAAASAWVSYRNWRMLAEQRHLMNAEGVGREQFMALIGVFVGTACVVGLIWAGIPSFFIDVCNSFR